MSIRFGIATFLFFVAAVSGQATAPDRATGQNTHLASSAGLGDGGPSSNTPGHEGLKGSGAYQGRPDGGAAFLQAGFSSGVGSGYQNFNMHTAPPAWSSGRIADGYATSGALHDAAGYAVGAPSGAGGMNECEPACAPSGMVVEGGPGCVGDGKLAEFCGGLAGNFAPGFYGGFEFLWLRPSFGQDVALIIDPPVGNTLVPFEYDNSLSPRAWLGWQSCRGNGARVTAFGFSDSAAPVSVLAVAGATPVYVKVYGAGSNLTRDATAHAGETLTSRHRLKLQVYDIEATQQFCVASTQAMFGFGVRIADFDQMLRADVYDAGGMHQQAVSNHLEFQGAGPTASLWLTRQIMNSRFSFYSNLRGAFLIGETDQRIYEMKNAFTTELEDRAVHREVLTNAECSVGLQFGQSLTPRCGAFVRVGYEAQVWLDAGGPVNSDSTLGFDGTSFAMGLAL